MRAPDFEVGGRWNEEAASFFARVGASRGLPMDKWCGKDAKEMIFVLPDLFRRGRVCVAQAGRI